MDGTPCNDGQFCTVGDSCAGGTCAGGGGPNTCDDGEDCTFDTCDEGLDVCDNDARGAAGLPVRPTATSAW